MGVPTLQPIIYNGELAAIVLSEHAIVRTALPRQDLRHIKAMCLYALELDDDGRSESYTDADADAYARAALARR